MRPKVIAFDLFGTLINMQDARREDLQAYGEHIKQPNYTPLQLPEAWLKLPPWPDVWGGLRRLRVMCDLVTMSNAPLAFQMQYLRRHDLQFDAIFPLDVVGVFKPQLRAYEQLVLHLGVNPSDVMMVTANEHFGDLEASARLGMRPQLIRGHSYCKTLFDLAQKLGG